MYKYVHSAKLPEQIQQQSATMALELPKALQTKHNEFVKQKSPSDSALANGSKQSSGPYPPVLTTHATSYLFRGFRILGIDMPKQHRVLYLLYSFVINTMVTIYLPLAFLMSYYNMSEAQLQIGNFLTSLQVAINVWGCSIKIIIMAFLVKKLKSAQGVMKKLDERCHAADEIGELKFLVRQGNRMVVMFAIAYWSYSTSTFLSSVLQGRPPYGLYIPVIDYRATKLQFFMSSMIEFVLIDIACFQQVVDDSYAVIYVCILRSHMKILLMRVQKLASVVEKSYDENLEELRLCIIDHKNLLELYDIIAPIISITIFIQFMITAAILGTTLINILLFATDFSSRIASCFYVLAVVVEIFPLCYYSQCLMDDSNRLAEVIFHHNWMDQDARYRKMLVFFMQRSQRVMALSAGKIFLITLNSFLSIAKFSFSLYTFIKEMGVKERFGLD